MSSSLLRDVDASAARPHDLIVIGGGIYGAFIALESARRGLRPLLVERSDFGGATSRAGLRIVHGGLRYLQSLDLRRCRQSGAERAWMFREFPELVRPLRCLVPLYGPGLRRPSAFGIALAIDRMLGNRAGSHLPPGRTLTADQVAAVFPSVKREGLLGGGVWHDGVLASPERMLVEVLRWAAACGATALNYVEATGLLRSQSEVAGITARDIAAGRSVEFRAPVVINCAGPWCREVAQRLDRDDTSLFHPSIAFNVLLDLAPPAPCAVAVSPGRPGRSLYFLVPCHGRVMAGTVHIPCDAHRSQCEPTSAQVARFLAELADAVPGWAPSARHVVSVLAGRLPAAAPASNMQAASPVILDHARLSRGGPRGLWSVSGVKYTTARLVAEATVQRTLGAREPLPRTARPAREEWSALLDPAGPAPEADEHSAERLARVIDEESVLHLDDLILRRSAWGLDPIQAVTTAGRVCELLPWDTARRGSELARLEAALGMSREPVAFSAPLQTTPAPSSRPLAGAGAGKWGRARS